MRGFLVGLIVSLTSMSAWASDYTFSLPARQFISGDRLVSASVFHWYTATGGQLSGPWRPVEGRQNWTGEPDFWARQIKDIMDANIDLMYVHLIPEIEEQRINLFDAMYQLRLQGYEVPKAVPFLDPAITWYKTVFPDVATTAGKDEWVGQYVRYFNQYFSKNADAQADGYLGIMNGRVMLDAWHMEHVVNYSQLTRADVESRLQAVFGAEHPVFNSGVYQIATPWSGLYPSWCDELVWQFSTNSYLVEWTGSPQVRSYTVKPGYWDQNIRDPGFFLARDGGVHYFDAWQDILNDSPQHSRVYIESWSEYDEGSGIYAADPGPPYIVPPNPNTDTWSSTANPREYIDTTAVFAAQFNRLPERDARFLAHDIPAVMYPGESIDARIVVRNEGNAEWSNAGSYKLGLQGPTLLSCAFDSSVDGWTLARNAFGTSGNTAYENGDWNASYGFSGGGLRTRTGDVDNTAYYGGASTAWARTFHLDQTMNVSIRFKYRLFVPGSLESSEAGEARFELDNQAYGLGGQSYLARFAGGTGTDQDTGWREYSRVFTLSGPADHTVEIGGWNNRKTAADEFVDVYVDDFVITDVDASSLFGPSRFLIDDSDDEIPAYGGIFRGRPKTFAVNLTAPAFGAHTLHFQMLQESVAWFGQSLDVAIEVLPLATQPLPPDGAVEISPRVILSWTPGQTAVGHRVYLGLSAEAVGSADVSSPEFMGSLPAGSESLDPPGVLLQGVDYYWRVDELQQSGPVLQGRVWRFTTAVIPGDSDEDGDVDQKDFGYFQACLSGTGQAPQPDCGRADLDADGDVDKTDLAQFSSCLGGPDQLPGC